MAKATANPPRIHCNAEWHLRANARAIGIYGLALHITKAKRPFFLSQPQVAEFFGWNLKTVRAAFKALRDSGLFTLVRSGSGGGDGHANYANVYTVTTHSKLAKEKHPCRPLPETGTLVFKAEQEQQGKNRYPLPETGRGPLPETGTLGPQPETGTLVYESTSKSTSDAVAPENQPSASPLKPKGKFSDFPKDFQPNDANRALASKLGLDIKESRDAFEDYHIHKGDRSREWNRAFNGWLRNARKFGRPQKPPQVPMFDALKAFRAQFEQK